MDLTPEENRLVEYAKEAIVKYNTIRHANGGIDTLYSFLLSDSGRNPRWNAKTTVILMQYIQRKDGWTFPKLEKYTIIDFYPFAYEEKEGLWDNWQPE